MTDTRTRPTSTAPSRLSGYRSRRDRYFVEGEHSPLTDAQRAELAELAYFPEDPNLAFVLPLDTSGPGIGERLTLAGGDGHPKQFDRVGRVTFEVDGQPVTLAVFRDVDRGRYFLPFRDATSLDETYPVGRYLDPQARPDGSLVVDFNYAYNPYCAYGPGWTCPIPPFENIIPVRIEAGERRFPLRHLAEEPAPADE
jgi:uncharacterized protein (DUF1684 family)